MPLGTACGKACDAEPAQVEQWRELEGHELPKKGDEFLTHPGAVWDKIMTDHTTSVNCSREFFVYPEMRMRRRVEPAGVQECPRCDDTGAVSPLGVTGADCPECKEQPTPPARTTTSTVEELARWHEDMADYGRNVTYHRETAALLRSQQATIEKAHEVISDDTKQIVSLQARVVALEAALKQVTKERDSMSNLLQRG